ncbi:hypothetical protein MIR68_002829 [Amoeboaphelidium protococcarum]|nr:hypothetical protein MIR68_002829 [Amoeboaphelidium protococcarum]
MASKFLGTKSLIGKTLFITGATQGIGLQAAKVYSALGCNVVLGCRKLVDGKNVIQQQLIPFRDQNASSEEVKKEQQFFAIKMDLSSLEDIHLSLKDYQDYVGICPDFIINNAGMMSKDRVLTRDDIELTFQSNYLSHAVFTHGMMRNIAKLDKPVSNSMRVINTSAGCYRTVKLDFDNLLKQSNEYDFWKVYCQSKLSQLVWSNYVHSMFNVEKDQNEYVKGLDLKGVAVESVCIDPGYIRTNLLRESYGFTSKEIEGKLGAAKMTVDDGAVSLVAAGLFTEQNLSGGFMFKGRVMKQTDYPQDKEVQTKLWNITKNYID